MADNFSDFKQTEDPKEGSVFDYIMFIVAGIFSVWGMYTSFVIVGGLAGNFIDSHSLRLMATLAVSVVFPILTGIGSFGDSTYFHDRVRRLGVTVTILTLASGLAIGLLLTKHVVPEMYSNPNWFLNTPRVASAETGIAKLNRKYTTSVANLTEQVAFDMGLYNVRPRKLGSQ